MIIICIRYVNKYVSFVLFFFFSLFLDVQILLDVFINFILLLLT